MDVGELWPADGLHLSGGVELHRARPQWDHRAVQRDVLVLQTAQIAEHLGLAAVGRKNRVREVLRGTHQLGHDTDVAFGQDPRVKGIDVETLDSE